MLTFLELYQTVLGFVFFKLYNDVGLVYPPPLDLKKDEGAAGVGAFSLQDASKQIEVVTNKAKVVEVDGRKVSGKDVRQAIKNVAATIPADTTEGQLSAEKGTVDEQDEEFVQQPSKSDNQAVSLPTLQSLSSLPQTLSTSLFSPYTFFLSRETSRPVFEFLVRSFGGRIGWPSSSGSGSPFEEDDEAITHVIIDRPIVNVPNETDEQRTLRRRRKYVQPQWVVDCINAGRVLLEEPYLQGKTLPPHLSPFGERQGAYEPLEDVAAGAEDVEMEAEEDEDEDEEIANASDDEVAKAEVAALKAVAEAEDAAALRAAELAAEAAGVDHGAFEKQVAKSKKAKAKAPQQADGDVEKDMNKMMMSNKQKKLYEKMKYSNAKKATEVRILFSMLSSDTDWFCSDPIWKKNGNHFANRVGSRLRNLLSQFLRVDLYCLCFTVSRYALLSPY